MCAVCGHMNFKKREMCRQCSYPKYGGPDVSSYLYNRTEVLAGDWYCTAMNCGAHNYASRTSCYSCGTVKNDYGAYASHVTGSDLPPGWKTGDWICTRSVTSPQHFTFPFSFYNLYMIIILALLPPRTFSRKCFPPGNP